MSNSQSDQWEKDARDWRLSSQQIEQLKLHGVLISNQSFKQIFEPYIGGKQVFITSDTVIQAYAVLLQDAVNQLELRMEALLRPFLIKNWALLLERYASQPANRPDYKSALEHAVMVSGTALHLLTGSIDGPAHLLKQIQEETDRVKGASLHFKPSWMGPKDRGFLCLDYSRFKPRGLYEGHPVLEPYFQAVSWLQAIPFRFDNDRELLSFMILLEGMAKIRPHDLNIISSLYSELLGPSDCVDLFHSNCSSVFDLIFGFASPKVQRPSLDSPQFLKILRQSNRFNQWRTESKPQINDQVSDLIGIVEPSLRFISARALPDSVYFSKTEVRRGGFPSGLEIATALGSPIKCRADLRPLVEEELRPLLEPKQSPFYGANPKEHRDRTLGELTVRKEPSLYSRFLLSLELIFRPDPQAAPVFHGEAWARKSLQTALAGWVHQRHIWVLQSKQNEMWLSGVPPCPWGFVEPVPEFFASLAQLAELTLKAFSYAVFSKLDTPVPEPEYVRKGPDPALRWTEFISLCYRLEALSHKQLRGAAFSPADFKWIDSYGSRLARAMFYEGNSYLHPKDDAPVVCDIYGNSSEKRYFHVAAGRPCSLYVLYPVVDGFVLMRGAVLTYYEFVHDSRLTDADWIEISKNHAPQQPSWLG